MKNKGVIGLSNKEKEIICELDHPEFTVDFIEDYLRNPPKESKDEPMAFRIHGRIEGFMAAVQQLKSVKNKIA